MKKKPEIVVLEMSPVGPFYSPNDEAAFFEWLDKIKPIKRYYGRLETLYIEVINSKVTEYELRELLAAFHRYKVKEKQLSVFDRKEFAPWFRNKNAPWYKTIFGRKSVKRTRKKSKKKTKRVLKGKSKGSE